MTAQEAERIRVIVANVRGLKSKAWNARHANWAVVCEVLGMGSARAREACMSAVIDPDGHS